MGLSFLGLNTRVLMILTNEVNTPSGNETTIFEGVISPSVMATLFPAGLVEPYTFNTTYLQDGKVYSVYTEVSATGDVTVKLHYKAPKR